MKKTIGILAHVDAGKTTFSEGLLYHTKSIRERGRVDHKNSYLDDHRIEKERGITIFSGYATMEYQGDTYYLVDTPGHTDFSSEMERSLQIMDYAVIIVSAVEGIEGHTETVWNLLRKQGVPTFFFINKIDRVGADPEGVLQQIKDELSQDAVDIGEYIQGDLNEGLKESVAERDEELMDLYFQDMYDHKRWMRKLKGCIKGQEIFPVAFGSALKYEGVAEFFQFIHDTTETDYSEEGEFKGRVFRIRYHDDGTRATYIKALNGTLSTRDEVPYGVGERKCQKVTRLLVKNRGKYVNVENVSAGDVFCLKGFSESCCGDPVGDILDKSSFDMIPMMRTRVVFPENLNPKEVYGIFKKLDEEDPALSVSWVEEFQHIHIKIMGKIQLQILKDILKDRFDLEVEFESPEIVYKETIEKSIDGYGHFEPIGHYAEVHLRMEPLERGAGIKFENRCHTDYLTRGHMNLIKHHIFEREHNGVLTGSALTDMKFILETGRAHNKHTSGGDFREATFRAIRQGLEQCDNVLLEPYYDFTMKVSIDHMGRVLADIQKASGEFEPPENTGDKVIIRGSVPVQSFMDYPSEFMAITGGRGSLSLRYGGYKECHNRDEVLEKTVYDRKVDMVYSSTSIFCAKGQSYLVPWDRVTEEMHCLKK